MLMMAAPGYPEVGLWQEQVAMSVMGMSVKMVVDMFPDLLLHHTMVAASHCTKVLLLPGVLQIAWELWPHPAPSSSVISLGSV